MDFKFQKNIITYIRVSIPTIIFLTFGTQSAIADPTYYQTFIVNETFLDGTQITGTVTVSAVDGWSSYGLPNGTSGAVGAITVSNDTYMPQFNGTYVPYSYNGETGGITIYDSILSNILVVDRTNATQLDLLFNTQPIPGPTINITQLGISDNGNNQSYLNQGETYEYSCGPGAAGCSAVAPSVPIPAAVWLFGSALAGLIGLNHHKSV